MMLSISSGLAAYTAARSTLSCVPSVGFQMLQAVVSAGNEVTCLQVANAENGQSGTGKLNGCWTVAEDL